MVSERQHKKVTVSFLDQIRRAVRTSGTSLNQLSRETGIDRAALSRFVRGDRGLSMGALDRLADFLDLGVVVRGEVAAVAG